MANLLSDYPGPVNAIAGYHRYSRDDPHFRSPCEIRHLRVPQLTSRIYDSMVARFPTVMARLARQEIRRNLRALKARAVMAVFPFEDFFIGAWQAASDLDLPCYAYMHDLWLENMPTGSAKQQAAFRWEERILRSSKRVLCMTEAMQDHYHLRYGIKTDLLPHVISDRDLQEAPWAGGQEPPKRKALFVGSLSAIFNEDALRTLAAAANLLPNDFEVAFCTPNSREDFARRGIQSNRLHFDYLTRKEVRVAQAASTVLVAPLSHKDCSLDEVNTVFSTKLLEYLLAGRPIVVFAPKDSFHAKSASKGEWAYVVTEDSPSALRDAILKVAQDKELSARLVAGALREAHRRAAREHGQQLWEWVQADLGEA